MKAPKALMAIALMAIATVGVAKATVYSDSVSTPTELSATGPWAGGSIVSWEISDEVVDGFWFYQYTITTPYDGKDISHLILEVCPEAEIYNVYAANSTFGTYGPGPSNPGIADTFYGMKIDLEDGQKEYSFSFLSENSPEIGKFYMKDGKDGSNWVYANSNSVMTVGCIPEPHTALLGGLGVFGLLRRRRL